jgi:hypothetical protein
VDQRAIDAEVAAMAPARIAATIDRSVLGVMVDFAKGIPFYVESGHWREKPLEIVEQRLAETPCRSGQKADRVIFPEIATRALTMVARGFTPANDRRV